MSQVAYGAGALIIGLGLVVFNKPISKANRFLTTLWGMGAPGVKVYQISTIVVGIFFAALGILFLLNIAHIQ
jgi:hypothetical protein